MLKQLQSYFGTVAGQACERSLQDVADEEDLDVDEEVGAELSCKFRNPCAACKILVNGRFHDESALNLVHLWSRLSQVLVASSSAATFVLAISGILMDTVTNHNVCCPDLGT